MDAESSTIRGAMGEDSGSDIEAAKSPQEVLKEAFRLIEERKYGEARQYFTEESRKSRFNEDWMDIEGVDGYLKHLIWVMKKNLNARFEMLYDESEVGEMDACIPISRIYTLPNSTKEATKHWRMIGFVKTDGTWLIDSVFL